MSVLLAFLLLLAVAIVGVVLLRAISPHSREMAAAQAKLNRRTGQTPTLVPIPPASESKWSRKNTGAVLLALVGGCFLWWLYNTDVHMTVLSSWAWAHWAFVVVSAAGIVWELANFANVSATKAAWGMTIVVLVLFSAGPIAVWWNTEPPHPHPASRQGAETVIAPVVEWPKLAVPANGTSERILLPFGMHHILVSGNNYRLYTVYQDGTECSSFGKEPCPDGSIAYYYIRNEMPIEDNILYTFVQK